VGHEVLCHDRDFCILAAFQGNRDLKQLLIHGARAVVATAGKKEDKRSIWINKLAAKVNIFGG